MEFWCVLHCQCYMLISHTYTNRFKVQHGCLLIILIYIDIKFKECIQIVRELNEKREKVSNVGRDRERAWKCKIENNSTSKPSTREWNGVHIGIGGARGERTIKKFISICLLFFSLIPILLITSWSCRYTSIYHFPLIKPLPSHPNISRHVTNKSNVVLLLLLLLLRKIHTHFSLRYTLKVQENFTKIGLSSMSAARHWKRRKIIFAAMPDDFCTVIVSYKRNPLPRPELLYLKLLIFLFAAAAEELFCLLLFGSLALRRILFIPPFILINL